MNSSLSFLSHVNHVISSSFYQLRRIKCSIKALPFDTAKSLLVNSFVISRIDYCNSLLTGLPKYALDRLQRVMNAATRMLCGAGKHSNVTGLIRDRLHWLPVTQRIQFKLCLMMYKAMHGLAPAYLSRLCASSCDEGRTRSSARGNLVVQRTMQSSANVHSSSQAWNRLPCYDRNCPSLHSFQTALKTLIFLHCWHLTSHFLSSFCCMHSINDCVRRPWIGCRVMAP